MEVTNKLIGDLRQKVETANSSPLTGLVQAMERDVSRLSYLKDQIRGQILEMKRADDANFVSKAPSSAGVNKSPVNVVPHPTSPNQSVYSGYQAIIDKNVAAGFNRIGEVIERSINRHLARRGLTGGVGGGFERFEDRVVSRQREEAFRAGRLPTFEKELSAKGSGFSEVSSRADRLREQEERLLKSLRARVQSEERYAAALEQARRQGFGIEDLKRVQSKGTAGIQQLQFQRTDESGIQKRFETFVQPSGKATPGISNQFRSFGQGVVRDIGELTKWSLALAAVYGPMRKLEELTQIMIENQTRLAEATVSVGSAFLDESGIFTIAADQAEQAGESISGVIDAFTQAYRATGGAGDQVQRLATAQNLLADSLVLSKLSTLDQAQAIDTLSAALRQSGGDLNNGTELLDKWVRVTKVANIDLASLATGFAVLGDAAEAAQISTDELNGILAAIGETGVSSGRELANTARAIVAGFQSDQAVEALERIGVATKTSTGEMRSFVDIAGEVSSLRQMGAIDDTLFSSLTLDIGGGTRRQAAVASLLESWDRVGQVASESSRASGDAQAALAKQLDTVQTSLTRLGNAFQELAQTLGTEGGFLGIITEGVNGMTALVKVFDALTGILGKATPAMAAFIATALVLKSQGKGSVQDVLSGLGSGLTRDPDQLRLAQVTGSDLAGVPAKGWGRQFLQNNVLGTNAISGGVQGLVAAAIPALMNATNKEDRFGGTKATADIIGGVGGGVIGALVAGSPVVGAAIGTAVAEAFVNSTIARKTDIFGYTAPSLLEPGKTPTNSGTDPDEKLRQAEIGLYKSIGFGNESLGRILSNPGNRATNIVEELNKAIADQDKKAFEEILGRYDGNTSTNKDELFAFGLGDKTLNQAFNENRQIKLSPEAFAYNLASDESRRKYDSAREARLARGDVEGQPTAFANLIKDNKDAFQDVITSIREASKQQISQDRVSGQLTGAQYGRRTEALTGFDTKALQYYTALGDRVSDLTGDADTAAESFQVLNNVIVYGSEDALPQLTAISGEIQELVNLLNDPALNKDALEAFGGADEARGKLDELRGTFANLLNDANQQALLSRINVPDVQGDINKPLTQQEFGQVSSVARELQDAFYKGFLQIPDDMYDALKSSWDEWAQIVEDSGNVFYQTVSEIDPQFFQQAMQKLMEDNKLASQQTSPFGIQQVDMTSQEGAGLQSTIDYYSRYLSQNFPQYEQKPEEFGVIFSDYVTDVLHGDNLAVKLALEKLVDLNQKQLDGMYNIPEGATFWVPLTAAYYRPKNEGGAGGLDLDGLGTNTSATDRNTEAINNLTNNLALLNEIRRSEVPESAREKYELSRPKDNLAFQNEVRRGQVPKNAYDKYYVQDNLALQNEVRRSGVPQSADSGPREAFSSPVTPGINPATDIFNALQNFFQNLMQRLGGGFSSQTSGQQVNPQVSARLDLRVDNNTQLMVDGRVLASVITPYLASDMLRLEASQGTVTKNYVI